jgi:hypothetical protein
MAAVRKSSGLKRRVGVVLALVTLAGALATGAPAQRDDHGSPGPAQNHQGVVQAVTPSGVLIKQLDGSLVTVPVDGRTRILVNGRPGLLRDVRPGYVAAARWRAGRPTDRLETVDPALRSSGGQGGNSQSGSLQSANSHSGSSQGGGSHHGSSGHN